MKLLNLKKGDVYTLIPNDDLSIIKPSYLWVVGEYKNRKYKCYKYFDNDFIVYNHYNKKVYPLDITKYKLIFK